MIRYVITKEVGGCDSFYNDDHDTWISDNPTLFISYQHAEEMVCLKNLQSSTTRIRRVEIDLEGIVQC